MSEFDWDSVRYQFNLDQEYTHIGAAMFIASHPRPVREAIDRHREALDRNPLKYLMDHEMKLQKKIREKAASYLSIKDPKHIALTGSTTMGLGTIYTGLNIQKDREMLMSEHNYYSHLESAKRAKERSGCKLREIKLYEELANVSQEELIDNVIRQIKEDTVLVGVTWVHSDTGLKMPVVKLAKELAKINKNRADGNKILLVLDGIHGFGLEKETFSELGCSFLIAGCHKWLCGPRGTGLIAGTEEAWQSVFPVIPEFESDMYPIISGEDRPKHMDGVQMSPGGFHSYENRWALIEAFDFVEGIGKKRIYERVYELARLCKEGLSSMSHVQLVTPMSAQLSSGVVSFEVDGFSAKEAVKALMKKKIVCSEAPYNKRYIRFSPGIYNTPRDVNVALDAVNSLKHGK